MGTKQNLRAVSVSPQVLETLDVNHCLQCSGPHPTFQKCLGKACPDASIHRQGRVTGRNILPTPDPTSHHSVTAPGNGVEGRQQEHAGLPSTTSLQRLTREMGKTPIPGSHGIKMEQVFGESPT